MPYNIQVAHCLAGGQLTPPDSPELPHKSTQRHESRMPFPRLLRRGKPGADQPPPPPRSSTFRRVDKMTEPFPLVLPDSPVESDTSSVVSKSPTIASELRRRSPTYNDLRSLAARHKDVASRRVDSPLLPSPIIRENHVLSDSFFTFHNPRPRVTAHRSYDELLILSHYCDEDSPSKTQNRIIEDMNIPDNLSEDSLTLEGDDSRSTSSDDAPMTPCNDRRRTATFCSDESGWLANETSCVERETKFKVRCVQVIEPSYHESDEVYSQIMTAKLAGPRRPRLVHISRPSSQASGDREDGLLPRQSPQTPSRPLEISRFSPDDTPNSPQQFTSPSLTPCPTKSSWTEFMDDSGLSSNSLMPAPLTLRTPQSNRSSSTVYSSTLEKLVELSDPFGVSPRREVPLEEDPNASDWTVPTNDWPAPPKNALRSDFSAPIRDSTPDIILSLEHRIRQLRQSIATITAVVNSFPDDMLCLDSPFICSIRAPHIPDSTYFEVFGKIFPRAPLPLISALAAWLIVDLWFERTIINSSAPGRDDELSAEGILQPQHATDFWTLPNQSATPPSPDLSHGLPSPELDTYVSYAWDANSPLRRIPMKVRCLLGITESTLLNESVLMAHEAALIRRMRVVRPSVNVIGSKLIEALRGQWDVDVWRCLRVMVEVIEESPSPSIPGFQR